MNIGESHRRCSEKQAPKPISATVPSVIDLYFVGLKKLFYTFSLTREHGDIFF